MATRGEGFHLAIDNTNELLRQYLPNGTDLSKHSATDLGTIQRSLTAVRAGHPAT